MKWLSNGLVVLTDHALAEAPKLDVGKDVAHETARILDYQRAWSANLEKFPPLRTG